MRRRRQDNSFRQDQQNVTARLDFDLLRTEEGGVRQMLNDIGAVLSRHSARVPEGENVTDAKVLFKVEMVLAAADMVVACQRQRRKRFLTPFLA